MKELILIILTIYGLCNIIVFSKITDPLRKMVSNIDFIYDLITCMMCLSFWFGVSTYFIFKPVFLDCGITYINGMLFGFFISGTVWLIHTIQEKMER